MFVLDDSVRVSSMTDFRSTILTNLRIYRDIVENPDWVEALNDTLNALDAAGFGKLVQNFCAQPDPERTYGTEAVMRCHKRCGTPPELPFLHSDSLKGVKTYQIEDGR